METDSKPIITLAPITSIILSSAIAVERIGCKVFGLIVVLTTTEIEPDTSEIAMVAIAAGHFDINRKTLLRSIRAAPVFDPNHGIVPNLRDGSTCACINECDVEVT